MQESMNKLISEIFSQSSLIKQFTPVQVRPALDSSAMQNGPLHNNGNGDEYSPHLPASADLLYAYVEAELDDLNVSLMFPEVHRQLAHNSRLQESYVELRELLIMEREDRLVDPPRMPSFDFSYLIQQPTPAALLEKSWNLDHLGRLIIEFTSELLQSIRPLDLQSAMVKSGQVSNNDKIFHYELKEQVEDLIVEIGVKPDQANPLQCHVAAWVAIPSRAGWPNWKNSRVEMKMGQEVLQSHSTDAFGRIIFEPIALASLPQITFEVTPVTRML